MTGKYIDIVMVGVPWCLYPRDTAAWESWSWGVRDRARGRSSLGTPKGLDANLEVMIDIWQPLPELNRRDLQHFILSEISTSIQFKNV